MRILEFPPRDEVSMIKLASELSGQQLPFNRRGFEQTLEVFQMQHERARQLSEIPLPESWAQRIRGLFRSKEQKPEILRLEARANWAMEHSQYPAAIAVANITHFRAAEGPEMQALARGYITIWLRLCVRSSSLRVLF